MNAQGRWIERLYGQIPSGDLTESELDAAIIRATNIYEGDRAQIKTIRVTLTLSRAVLATEADDGKVTYRKAETLPEWPDNSPGTPAYNENLRRMAEAEERRHREEDEARARNNEHSPWQIERRARLEEIDHRVAESVRPLREEIGALRAEIAALRQQLAVTVAA